MTAPERPSPPPDARAPWERWLLVAIWVAAAALGWIYLGRGWIPHDVGTLGQAAERVLSGQLPHGDFVDMYTGGQAMLHALAFRIFGGEAMTLRWVFFGAWLAWIPAVWWLARTFSGPWQAAAATLLAAAATLPVYPEGMPSWYNLFLATVGAACLMRYVADRRARWVLLAGAAGGVSMLFKIVGLYYLGGALLFLLWLEADNARGGALGDDAAYRVFAATVLAVTTFAAVWVVTIGGNGAGIVHFLVPPIAVSAMVAARLLAPSGRSSGERFVGLARTAGPLVAGAVIPVLAFMVPYAATGSLGALYEGVFVLPRTRLGFPAENSLPVLGFLPAALLATWVAARSRMASWVGVGLVAAAVAMSHVDIVYRVVWWTLISLGPVVAVAGAWSLARATASSSPARAGGVLALAVFAYANLIQLPYSAPIYFLYAAPLLLLATLALGGNGRNLLAVTTALCAFFVLRVDAGFIHHLGFRYRPHEETEALELPRARGIRVAAHEKTEVEQLVAALDRIEPGGAILALPDAPEVYFLSGRSNPTPTLFDVFENADLRTERVLDLVEGADLHVVVLNRRPVFAPPVEGPLLEGLRARLGFAAEVGRFVILWAGPPAAPATTEP